LLVSFSGPQDVGHEGVPTRCRDFSLPSFSCGRV